MPRLWDDLGGRQRHGPSEQGLAGSLALTQPVQSVFAIAVAAYLLLAVGLLNRALRRHRAEDHERDG
ncbi:hypothetical protein AB5J62_40685 [Amycolatopsis sp. cg5]|uniref:hypothetical protein n=1 Tax=Amycolatopsis sp. cg5 TaxID=3238802 RepID=UPI0035248250